MLPGQLRQRFHLYFRDVPELVEELKVQLGKVEFLLLWEWEFQLVGNNFFISFHQTISGY